MQYRSLGKTGVKVSEISFGIGNNNITDDGEGVRMLEGALDIGINLYDTANAEKGGKVEEWLGTAFSGSKREKVVIATKFKGGATRKHIMASCDQSLKRLGMEYIDLYQFFRFPPDVPIEESLEALTDLVRQGKILYAGATNFKTYQLANSLRASERNGYTKIVASGPKYNLLGQDVFSPDPMAEVRDIDMVPFCEEEKMGLVPFRPLAGGLLTGKYAPGQPPEGDKRYGGTRYVYPDFVEKARPLLEVVEKLKPMAAQRGETMSQFSLAWILSKPAVSSVLVGANTPAQLKECADAGGHKLTAQELKAVDEIRKVLPGVVVG